MPSRRRVLSACLTGLVGCVGLAGCLGDGDDAATTTPTDAPTSTSPPPTETPTDTPTSTREPRPGADRVDWRRSLDGRVAHAPALDGDRCYVGTESGTVAALSRRDGGVAWRYDAGRAIRGAPTVAGDVVLVVAGETGLGDHHVVHGVDAATGDRRFRVAPESWWLTVLGAADGTAFVATSDDNLQSDGQTLYALSLADGSTRWTVEVGDNHGGFVTDERVFVPTYGTIAVVGTDGTERWTRDVGEYQFRTLGVVDDVAVYVTASDPRDPTVHGVDVATGDPLWTFDEWRAHTTRVHDGRVFVGGQRVAELDPATGESLWVADRAGALYGVPVADGTLYTAGDDVDAVALSDGTVRWSRGLDASLVRPVGRTDGRVVVHNSASDEDRNRHVVALDADGGERAWRFVGRTGTELTTPAVADGRVFLAEWDTVFALSA